MVMRESSLCVFLFRGRSLKRRDQLLGFGLEIEYVFLLIFTLLPNSQPIHPTISHLLQLFGPVSGLFFFFFEILTLFSCLCQRYAENSIYNSRLMNLLLLAPP
jgi:hypothetical protein